MSKLVAAIAEALDNAAADAFTALVHRFGNAPAKEQADLLNELAASLFEAHATQLPDPHEKQWPRIAAHLDSSGRALVGHLAASRFIQERDELKRQLREAREYIAFLEEISRCARGLYEAVRAWGAVPGDEPEREREARSAVFAAADAFKRAVDE